MNTNVRFVIANLRIKPISQGIWKLFMLDQLNMIIKNNVKVTETNGFGVPDDEWPDLPAVKSVRAQRALKKNLRSWEEKNSKTKESKVSWRSS